MVLKCIVRHHPNYLMMSSAKSQYSISSVKNSETVGVVAFLFLLRLQNSGHLVHYGTVAKYLFPRLVSPTLFLLTLSKPVMLARMP